MSQQSDGLCLDLKLDWSWKAHCEDFADLNQLLPPLSLLYD